MARYSMTKVSDTCYRLSTGRDTIGWVRKNDDSWAVSSNKGAGSGATPKAAFQDFMRGLNNAIAKGAGFSSATEMVNKQNEQVRAQVSEWNAVMGDVLPMRVRSGRRVIV